MKARPDDFVLLIANEFSLNSLDYIHETHLEYWQEALAIDLDEGAAALPELTLQLTLDPAISDLVELAGRAVEPFGASDLAMLQRHTGIWRIHGTGRFAAWPLMRFASTCVESGASAIFLPGTRQLHSPRAVRRLAMDAAPDAIANFFVSAFDADGWMRTRGLTPFALPELETKIVDGHNAAYFRLMDVAAAMIENGRAFDDGASLMIGPALHTISAPAASAVVDELSINGIHGIRRLTGVGS